MGHIPFLPLSTVVVRLGVDLSALRLHMSTWLKERQRVLTKFVGVGNAAQALSPFIGGQ